MAQTTQHGSSCKAAGTDEQSVFLAKVQSTNDSKGVNTALEYIRKNGLLPTNDAAATKNEEGNGVIECEKNSFGWFKSQRTYQLKGTTLQFYCEKSYKGVTSGGYTVFFGSLSFDGETLPVKAWNSDKFTSLRKELNLPVPDKQTTNNEEHEIANPENLPTSQEACDARKENAIASINKDIDALQTRFEGFGIIIDLSNYKEVFLHGCKKHFDDLLAKGKEHAKQIAEAKKAKEAKEAAGKMSGLKTFANLSKAQQIATLEEMLKNLRA